MSQAKAKTAAAGNGASADTTDVVQSVRFSETELRSIDSFAEAVRLAEQEYGAVVDAEQEMGDGFNLVKDLAGLQDVPVVLLEWSFRDGDFGKYVSLRFVAQTSTGTLKGIYNDGSTGICKQLEDYSERTGHTGGLVLRQGFRVSEYEYDDGSGRMKPAKTWYLNV